jgi:TonB family protein
MVKRCQTRTLALVVMLASGAAMWAVPVHAKPEQQRIIEGDPIPLNSTEPGYWEYFLSIGNKIREKMRERAESARSERSGSTCCVKDLALMDCQYKSATLTIDFGIFQSGRVADVTVRKGTDWAICDDFAIDAIKLASPFPPVPPELMARATRGSLGIRVLARVGYKFERSSLQPKPEPHPLDPMDYFERVRQRIEPILESPCVPQGVACEYKATEVTVEFGIGTDGRVGFVRVVSPSPWPIYDEYSVRAIRLASPFPPVPGLISREGGCSIRTTIKYPTGRTPTVTFPDTVDPRGAK